MEGYCSRIFDDVSHVGDGLVVKLCEQVVATGSRAYVHEREKEAANEMCELSIVSAFRHRFVQEEVLAMKLFGEYYGSYLLRKVGSRCGH